MPNRCQKGVHDHIYRWIVARDGEYCLICGKRSPRVKLEIDHADTNIDNWDPSNLHLLCQRCNLKMRRLTVREHKKLIESYSAINVCEREREFGNNTTNAVREMVDYQQGSVEMKANSIFEVKYREWIMSYLKENRFISKQEAINSGAFVTGANPVTVKRYLSTLTSALGPLTEAKDGTGTVIIVFKERRVPSRPGTHRDGQAGKPGGSRRAGDTVPVTRSSSKRRDHPGT